MNSLVKEIIKGLLPEEEKQTTTAVYAGDFKPPTSGHFEVVQQALKENPEIDEFIIFIGAKERDGISQDESLLIWEIYNNYLPFKVKIVPTSVAPIRAVYDYAKNHPTREVLWVIGAREGNEEDFKDITSRTKSISKYPNLELRTIVTQGGVSGTAARNASKVSFEKFIKFIPSILSDEEKQEVYSLVSNKIQEVGEANTTPYKWRIRNKSDYSITYEFATDSGAYYLVKFHEDEDEESFSSLEETSAWEMSFFVRSEVDDDGDYSYSSSRVVNKGELYKVMSTIVDITKNLIKEFPNTKKLSFQPSRSKGDDSVDNQRGKLYKAFVSRQIPQAKIDQEGSTVTIHLPEKVPLNENASYTSSIDIIEKIAQLTNHMIKKGMNIEPLPSVSFVDGDVENAKNFLGKTAYYDPERKHIVLYTEGRHPKDIVRSYAHEMVHHIQNLEGRLGNITTTNTMEDDHLDKLEQEANLGGTMTFRNWTDSLQESKKNDPFGLNAYAQELGRLREDDLQEKYVLQDLEDKFGIDLDLYDNGKALILSRIVIPKEKRGQGIGSKIMNLIVQYADTQNKPIYLTPTKDFGATSTGRLEQFYKQFGFKKKDKSDFSNRETMVREPLNEKKH